MIQMGVTVSDAEITKMIGDKSGISYGGWRNTTLSPPHALHSPRRPCALAFHRQISDISSVMTRCSHASSR